MDKEEDKDKKKIKTKKKKERIISSGFGGIEPRAGHGGRLSKLIICCEGHSRWVSHTHRHRHTHARKNNLKKNVSPVRLVSDCMPQSE